MIKRNNKIENKKLLIDKYVEYNLENKNKAINEFGIINKYRGISTYYKSENGKLYWLEQIEKYAPK
ncbi:hypothetical protein [Fusobacterium periodonticum]|uniref:hypothetical protein n=1 Tax=Fusobacterium periodonticum TaxID=860 RepID=UPI0028D244F8|nr:hypothetical protein [Fusobacterium periodonticum]